jgi:hypothetical protein
MSFFPKKMSQNDWATILPFGPVTNFLLAQKPEFTCYNLFDNLD